MEASQRIKDLIPLPETQLLGMYILLGASFLFFFSLNGFYVYLKFRIKRNKPEIETWKSSIRTLAAISLIGVFLLVNILLLIFPGGDPEDPHHYWKIGIDLFWIFLCWRVYCLKRWAGMVIPFLGVGLSVSMPLIAWLYFPLAALSGAAVFQKSLWAKGL